MKLLQNTLQVVQNAKNIFKGRIVTNTTTYEMATIQNTLDEYLTFQRELIHSKKKQKDLKDKMATLEGALKSYMEENHLTNLTSKNGEVILYGKKVAQTFKKETIIETLTDKLQDSRRAEELTESIIQNKKFKIEDKIKAVVKN